MSDDGRESWETWIVPEVGGDAGRAPGSHMLTAKHLEQIQQQAREEGFNQGRREGLEAGRREIQGRVQRLEGVLQCLARPLEELDDTIEEELVQLAVTVARHLVRRELRTDPGQVVAAVREAVSALPAAEREVRVQLHPDDVSLVRDALSIDQEAPAWQLVSDPMMSRGGCRVSSGASRIDATVENRLNAVIAAVLGGERETDAEGEA